MSKYLKISVSSPYPGTEQVRYEEVDDSYEPEGKDEKDARDRLSDAVWEYAENSYTQVVDESEVPEGER